MNPAPVQYEYKLALDYKDVDPILFMSFFIKMFWILFLLGYV